MITKDEDGNIQEDRMVLDPEKTLYALQDAADGFLGKPMSFWAEVIAQHAQPIADAMTAEEFDDLNVEAMGYER